MELLFFGDTGWGDELFFATLMTIAVSIASMVIGFLFALVFTPLKLSKNKSLNIIYLHRGIEKKYIINRDFLHTPESKSLNEFRKPLMESFGLLKNGSAGLLKNGETEYKINGPVDLIENVVKIGKQGLQINRYKGLGEMNPDQLWETTLDKNYRSLLLVKLDEVDQANAVFETLMGDITEGRKNFIQENSLKVANLDI